MLFLHTFSTVEKPWNKVFMSMVYRLYADNFITSDTFNVNVMQN